MNIISGLRGCFNLVTVVGNADYQEMALVFQGFVAGIEGYDRLLYHNKF